MVTSTPAAVTEPTRLHVPSDVDINRKCAELLGYRVDDYRKTIPIAHRDSHTHPFHLFRPQQGTYCASCRTEEIAWQYAPNFCSSDCPHSLTAQLLDKINQPALQLRFTERLKEIVGIEDGLYSYYIHYRLRLATPRQVAVAVLLALNAYPSEWSVPTP